MINAATLLKYANVQMASESLFGIEPQDEPGSLKFSDSMTAASLELGNTRSSKFTAVQAAEFTDEQTGWRVIEHKSNTTTGFSGTLFKSNATGELVLSLRSTEFADDAARDNQATNTLEIKEKGWAFGQISDMQVWYQSLVSANKIPAGSPLTVTGYSLGGHLATAFSLLNPGAAQKTYTFNGAGVGEVDQGQDLRAVISEFTAHRAAGAHGDRFNDADVKARYEQLRGVFKEGASVNLTQVQQALQGLDLLVLGEQGSAKVEALLLHSALQRVESVVKEVERVNAGISSGSATSANAQPVAMDKIAATSLDYQLAVLQASEHTAATRTAVAFESKVVVAYSGREIAPNPIPRFFDVYGDTSPSGVANSQIHHGAPVPVWIEDQPTLRGEVIEAVRVASGLGVLAADFKLLAEGFSKNDFGDTHSLVLLVDSLSVQNLFLKLQPKASQAHLNAILKAGSNAAVDTGYVGTVGVDNQGLADGTTLENTLNALARYLGVAGDPLKGDPNGGSWAELNSAGGYTGREDLHNRIAAIDAKVAELGLAGKLTVLRSGAELASDARTNFNALVALQTLSPIYLKGSDAAGQTALIDALKNAHSADYLNWQLDKSAVNYSGEIPGLNFTAEWIADRAAMLAALNQRNTLNLVEPLGTTNTDYVDVATGLTLHQTVHVTGASANKVVFGHPDGGTITGTDNFLGDRLYGSAKADTLDGGAGNDHLEGREGNDVLLGGAGNDRLDGGKGYDTYKFSASGWGKDVVLDSDGQGRIVLGDVTLGKVYLREGADSSWTGGSIRTWIDESGTYLIRESSVQNVSDLIISRRDDPLGASITIKSWSRLNNLGIALEGVQPNSRTSVNVSPQQTSITTGEGNEQILLHGILLAAYSGGGNDRISVGYGTSPVVVDAGAGDDYITSASIFGGSFTGGVGNDIIYIPTATSAQTVLHFSAGDGYDLLDVGSLATLNIQKSFEQVQWGRNADPVSSGKENYSKLLGGTYGTSLVVDLGNGDGFELMGYFDSPTRRPLLQFTNGNLRPEDVAAYLAQGTEGNDTLLAMQGLDVELHGRGGNDVLYANATGKTTIRYGKGDGADIAWSSQSLDNAYSHSLTTKDAIYLGPELSRDEMKVYRYIDDLSTNWDGDKSLRLDFGGGDTLTIRDYFSSLSTDEEQFLWRPDIVFADGSEWGADDFSQNAILLGGDRGTLIEGSTDQANMIKAGRGNDSVTGGAFADTYFFDVGDGEDLIYTGDAVGGSMSRDVVKFGSGLNAIDAEVLRGAALTPAWTYVYGSMPEGMLAYLPNFLRIQFSNGDAVQLRDYFGGAPHQANFEFADGTVWGLEQILQSLSNDGWYNNAPLASALMGTSVRESTRLSHTLPGDAFTDIDHGDTLTYSASLANGAPLPYWLGFDAGSRTLYGMAPAGSRGEYSVRITATDQAGAEASSLLSLHVNPDFSVPNKSSTSHTLSEGYLTLILIGDEAIDGTGNAENNHLTGNAAANTLDGFAGDDVLSGRGGNDTYRFGRGDGADTILAETGTEPDQLNTLQFKDGVVGTDIILSRVGDALVFNIAGTSDTVTANAFFHADASFQPVQRVLFADGSEWNRAALIDILAHGGRLNRAPIVAQPIADVDYSGTNGQTFAIPSDAFRDPDGDTLSYGASLSNGDALPAWLSFDAATRTFSGTPGPAHSGSIELKITAIDAAGATASSNFVVNVTFINNAPTLTGTQVTLATGTEDTTYTITHASLLAGFSDVDGDVLSVADLSASEGSLSAFNAATQSWTFTPDANANGAVQLSYRVSDGTASTAAIQSFTLAARNDAPTVSTATQTQSATEDTIWTYTIPAATFADVDAGDTLSYSASLSNGSALPAWLSFNAATRTFSGTPGNAQVGAVELKVTATDAAGAAASSSFTVNVTNVNDAPTVVAGLPTQAATEGAAWSYTVPTGAFADVDVGDMLTYSATRADGSALPAWLSFNANTRTLAGTPPVVGGSQLSVRVVATDLAGASASSVLTLNAVAGDAAMRYSSTSASLGANERHLTLTGNAAISAYGNTLDNQLVGNSAANTLNGGDGNDVLTGDAGNDSLQGGKGNDTYVFNQGDGADTIDDYDATAGNQDTLRLGAGLTAAGTQVVGNRNGDLVLSWTDSPGDSVTVQSGTYGNGRGIEALVFADGTTLGMSDLYTRMTIQGSAGNDNLSGLSAYANRMYGFDGNDNLYGGNLVDHLEGGKGNDRLSGGAGNDTYVFNQGDGADIIEDFDTTAGNQDTLRLGAGLTASNLQVVGNSNGNMVLSWADSPGDSVTVQLGINGNGRGIEAVAFADGTTWGASDLYTRMTIQGSAGSDSLYGLSAYANRIYGFDGNDNLYGGTLADHLEGGKGNDSLQGGKGNDTYVFNQGDGADTIDDYDATAGNQDTLRLGAGLTAASAQVVGNRNGDLVLSWTDSPGDSVTMRYATSSNSAIETVAFADGTTWGMSDLYTRMTIQGSTGSDSLSGPSAYANRMYGLDGNDTLYGGNLADHLEGGKGNDSLQGGKGNDTYVFNQGDGADTIDDYDATVGNQDTLRLGAGLTAAGTQVVGNRNGDLVLSWTDSPGDSVTMRYATSSSGAIETVAFADGMTWGASDLYTRMTIQGSAGSDYLSGLSAYANRMYGLDGNDTLYGGTLADHLEGGKGNDSLQGGKGNDTYVFNQGDGADTIDDYDATAGNQDTLRFDAGIAHDQLWFNRVGNDLKVSVLGSTEGVSIRNWYHGAGYQIEQIKTSDNQTLLHTQVDALVQAMAAFAPPAAGQSTLPANYQSALAPVIAASWN
jgi:Ca2+-binding RTX toxin-like protein